MAPKHEGDEGSLGCVHLDCAHGARLPPTRRAVGLRVGREPRRSLAEDERDSGSTEEPGAAQHVDLHRTLERRGRVGYRERDCAHRGKPRRVLIGHCAGRAAHRRRPPRRGGRAEGGDAARTGAMGVRIGVAIGSAKLVRGGRHRLVRGLRGQRAPSRDAKHRARQLRCLGRLHERREECGGRDERRIKQQYVARARLQRHLEAHQPPPTQPFEPTVP